MLHYDRQLSQISDLVSFRTLAQLAALRTGQVVVISTLARDAKLNAVTAGRYLNLLAGINTLQPGRDDLLRGALCARATAAPR